MARSNNSTRKQDKGAVSRFRMNLKKQIGGGKSKDKKHSGDPTQKRNHSKKKNTSTNLVQYTPNGVVRNPFLRSYDKENKEDDEKLKPAAWTDEQLELADAYANDHAASAQHTYSILPGPLPRAEVTPLKNITQTTRHPDEENKRVLELHIAFDGEFTGPIVNNIISSYCKQASCLLEWVRVGRYRGGTEASIRTPKPSRRMLYRRLKSNPAVVVSVAFSFEACAVDIEGIFVNDGQEVQKKSQKAYQSKFEGLCRAVEKHYLPFADGDEELSAHSKDKRANAYDRAMQAKEVTTLELGPIGEVASRTDRVSKGGFSTMPKALTRAKTVNKSKSRNAQRSR
ncbi:hypothetical protein PRZ48_015239 [Zasmidium cellare]|uniref:Uncharacterized protein n=1 Tax=Zasmidium cellare TaxID=395010 RepID=A0ABR0DY05_ZASCE|nr:hypothetical protein PRZ48_015239 [Zasmidium cellare]